MEYYLKVKYAAEIDGYGVDSKALAQMESLGLPTGFSFSQATPAMGPVPEKQKKGDKKTFYCQICLRWALYGTAGCGENGADHMSLSGATRKCQEWRCPRRKTHVCYLYI